MARPSGIGLVGDKRLRKKFKNLESMASRNRVIRRPLANALTPISKEAKRTVPKKEGFLKRSIIKKVKAFRDGIWGGVGPSTDKKFTRVDSSGKKSVPSKYAPLVEFGTMRTRAQPFLRPAFDKKKAVAMQIFNRGVKGNLIKEARRPVK